MSKSSRLRCLVCGHHHEGPHDRHHCLNCFADRAYLRPAAAPGATPAHPTAAPPAP